MKEKLQGCKAEEYMFYARKYFAKKDLPPIAYKRLMKCYDRHNTYPNKDNKYISLNEILFMASRFKLVEGVKVSLKNGADIHYRDNKGRTALIFAGSSSNGKIIQLLLNSGADINAQDKEGMTALMEASYWGNLDTLKTLLKNGANVNIEKGRYKYTALEYALEQISRKEIDKKVAEVLIKHGAKLSDESQKEFNRKRYLQQCDKNNDRVNDRLDEMLCVENKITEEAERYEKEAERHKKQGDELKSLTEKLEKSFFPRSHDSVGTHT